MRQIVKVERALAKGGLLILAAFVGLPTAATGQDQVEIVPTRLDDGVYMLVGQGGNLGLTFGDDGTFLIDDQFAPLTPAIVAAIGELTGDPVRFVLNTHWHGDHTGGNENLGEAGALIVAHENVRARMSVETIRERPGQDPAVTPASPDAALPVVTFTEEMSFHLNGQELRVLHVPHAHTDGDVIILFEGSNVVHMGDTFFNGRYPFIDVSSGGSIDGYIAAQGRALALMDGDTQVIPGHGALGTRDDLQRTRDALKEIRDRVLVAKREGATLEQVLGMNLTADFDQAVFGGAQSQGTVGAIYQSVPVGR